MAIIARVAFAAVALLGLSVTEAAGADPLSGSFFTGDLTTLSASTYVVNSTGNAVDVTIGDGICETATGNGVCTLRAAVQESNASLGDFDTIEFDIPGTGPHTINNPAVPAISDPVAIDATTEPDFAGSPVIEMKGIGGSGAGQGFTITAGNSLIRGFAMNRFNFAISITTAGGNAIEGNYIGTDITGMTSSGLSNYQSAVAVSSSNNTIGGTVPAARNVLSGNGSSGVGHGVSISGGTGNVVAGNYIGLNAAGTAAIGNAARGVHVPASGNIIGGSTGTTPGGACTGSCNVISGNATYGVGLASDNIVKGNFIGLDPTGTTNIGNADPGVATSGLDNVIGGTTPAERNVISGNGFANVQIDNATTPTTGNVVQGNYIGTDPTGTIDRSPGGNYGIVVDGENTIGGTTGTTPGGACTGACNVIAGNGSHGIAIQRRPNPTIEGNFIGLKPDGASTLSNGGDGIHTFIAGNTIGGTTPAGRNVIAGNGSNGVELATSDNVLRGNLIGFSSDGSTVLGNGTWSVDSVGVNTVGGTSGVTPGGACTGDCNVILGMVTRATGTVIQGNFMGGVRPDGMAAATGSGGTLQVATNGNVTVGGDTPQERNVIAGGATGVDVFAPNVRVQGNYIGVGTDGTTPIPNAVGVHVRPVNGALIGGTNPGEGNVIANNTTDGVELECRGAFGSAGHRVTGNSIHSNGALGFDICPDGVSLNDTGDPDTLPPNAGQNFPVVSTASISPGYVTVTGTLNSNAGQSFTIDLYGNSSCDPSGYGEGERFLGSITVNTNGSGNASYEASLPVSTAPAVITATATSSGGSTSEFSQCKAIGYARPIGATPLRVPLVPAQAECTSPNAMHGPALVNPSCSPAVQTSSYLTVGTPPGEGGPGGAANSVASVRLDTTVGNPGTPADEADVPVVASATDVRCRPTAPPTLPCGPANGTNTPDYGGALQLELSLQITDASNGPSFNEPATAQAISFPVTLPCATSAATSIGSTCDVTTTLDTVTPGAVVEGKRSVWETGQIVFNDGGPDGDVSTTPNDVFMVQGLFVP